MNHLTTKDLEALDTRNPNLGLLNKVVCISGCSRGLGRALAIEFSQRGWQVAGGARNSDSLGSLRRKLASQRFLEYLDVTDGRQVEEFAKGTINALGCPDLLLNNAGIINANAKLKDIAPEEFAQVLSTNLGGVHNLIRAFLPAMEKRGKGTIVNFSSYWGQSSAPEVGPYCASKWGVEGLTRSLSQEIPVGLCAVAFNPGIVDTDMLRSCFGKEAGNYEKPLVWAKKAVDCLISLGPQNNGDTVGA